MYHNIKSLSGFEYQITISDFKDYFSIYPIPFQKTTVISIIKKIESKVKDYQDKKEEANKKRK